MIQLINIIKNYDNKDTNVLNIESFSVEPNTCVGIYGHSGSGKSTLLRILGITDTDYKGIYYCDTEDVGKTPQHRHHYLRKTRVSSVFQDSLFDESLTIFDNLYWVAILHERNESEFVEYLKILFDIASLPLNLLQSTPRMCSGGEKQRISLVRALLTDTPLLICDEPTGALDSKSSHQLMRYITSLNKTLVIATHNPDLKPYFDKTYSLENGALIET